jgi:hypothetical protein
MAQDLKIEPIPVPKFRLAILLGCLSMLYGEVYCASSTFWMISPPGSFPFGLLVTFPLYMFHSLFYLNLALRSKRTTLPHLYFWGTLFALYEAPITKVLFSGYAGSTGPGWGLVGGVAIMEFLMVVLFWHPVMSFMMPILTLQMMLQGAARENIAIFPSHLPILTWDRKAKAFFIGITAMSSVLMAYGDRQKGVMPDIVLMASLLVIVAVKAITPMKGRGYTIPSFRLGNAGFAIVCIYLVWLYAWAIPTLIPGTLALITPGSVVNGTITLLVFVLIVCITLYVSGPDALTSLDLVPISPEGSSSAPLMTARHLIGLWGLLAVLIFVWSVLPFGFAFLALLDMLFGIALPTLGVLFLVGMSVGLYHNKKAMKMQKS